MGDAVGQKDLRGHDGPEQGGTMAAPEKKITQEALKKLRSTQRWWMHEKPCFKT